jgi:hypothetical protein
MVMEMNLTRGLIILVILYKQVTDYEDALTMSFYMTLSSDGCKDAFPNNHGGDFMVQLDKILDMRGYTWEVALVEMIYTGQAFPNLGIEDSQITLKVSGKPQYENDYIITYDQVPSMRLSFSKELNHFPNTLKTCDINLPLKHYSFPTFIETLKKSIYDQFNMDHIDLSETEFKFSEKNMTFNKLFRMNMSEEFRTLFGIDRNYKQIHDHEGRWVHFKHAITKIPKPVSDSSLLFYSPYVKYKNCKFEINGEVIFELTLQYWTVNMFKRAINMLGKNLKESGWLSIMNIEEGSSAEDCNLVLTPNILKKDKNEYVKVSLSEDFKTVFQTNASTYLLKFTEPLKIHLSINKAEDEDRQWPNYEATKRLQHNYYPEINSLIKELNEVLGILIIDIAKQRNSSTAAFIFFNVNNDIVNFNGKDGFTVLLSTGLLKMMHLPSSWLIKTVTGSQSVVMKTYKRSHFYIHLDCLDYHYINNNVSDLIKVVANSATIDEKLQLTFSEPHYYKVAKRYMSTINMFITDSYFDGILQFDRDVAYTLHFRRCLHSL